MSVNIPYIECLGIGIQISSLRQADQPKTPIPKALTALGRICLAYDSHLSSRNVAANHCYETVDPGEKEVKVNKKVWNKLLKATVTPLHIFPYFFNVIGHAALANREFLSGLSTPSRAALPDGFTFLKNR